MSKEEIELNDFIFDEIESIELIGEDDTIDITVEDTHMFYCNDIYTHNSSIKSDVVEGDQMGGSIKKAQIGHFLVSVAKSLEQRENGTANMAILKSRFGQSGMVFEDILFDNSTIQIEIFDKSKGVSFMNRKEDIEKKKQDKVRLLMEQAEKQKNNN